MSSNENTESTTTEQPPQPGLRMHLVELEVAQSGPPVFDIEVPMRSAGVSAEVLDVHYRVVQSSIVAKRPSAKILTQLVFLCDETMPKEKRRVAIITPTAAIPPELADDAHYLGTYRHPANDLPICVFEFPWSPLVEQPAEEPDDKPADVLAAIAAVRAAHETPTLSVVNDTATTTVDEETP